MSDFLFHIAGQPSSQGRFPEALGTRLIAGPKRVALDKEGVCDTVLQMFCQVFWPTLSTLT